MVKYQYSHTWLLYAKVFVGLASRVGSCSLLGPTRNTSPKPHLQKVLPCGHPCHHWDFRLRTPCEVLCPNFHDLIWLGTFRTWDPMWTSPWCKPKYMSQFYQGYLQKVFPKRVPYNPGHHYPYLPCEIPCKVGVPISARVFKPLTRPIQTRGTL